MATRPPEDARPQWATPPPPPPAKSPIPVQRRRNLSRTWGAIAVGTVVAAAVIAYLASPSSSTPSPTPGPSRTYLHPTADIVTTEASCDSDGAMYVIAKITNHAGHNMAYDIVYTAYSKAGAKVGTAEAVFELAPHQVLPDQRINQLGTGCGPTIKLTSVRAYDTTGEDGQPNFS